VAAEASVCRRPDAFWKKEQGFFICARNQDALIETCAELAEETGGDIHFAVADTANEADLAPLVRNVQEKTGGVDILVNNAGTMRSGGFEALDDVRL